MMTPPFSEQLFLASFESMSIGTQFSDSSNKANVYTSYVMVMVNLQVQRMKSTVCLVILFLHKCHTTVPRCKRWTQTSIFDDY